MTFQSDLNTNSHPSAAVAIGAVFSTLEPNQHAFSLADPTISFPYQDYDTVSVPVLAIVVLIGPAVIIAAVSLLLVPGAIAKSQRVSSAQIWKRKLWEWNAGWLGLGVSLAGVFVVTEGIKDLVGRPRPDMLGLCQPDLENLDKYIVSGLGATLPNPYSPAVLVTLAICKVQTKTLTHDGFSSFPSGHTSFTWSGMTYLTLFLCAKFGVLIPYLAPRVWTGKELAMDAGRTFASKHGSELESTGASSGFAPKSSTSTGAGSTPSNHFDSHHHHQLHHHHHDHEPATSTSPLRTQAAAPPLYLLSFPLLTIGVAVFVTASRWFDYKHHSSDLAFSTALGMLFGWIGFRMYHLPVRRGEGWAWGIRGRERAFWLGVGRRGGWGSGDDLATEGAVDVESGNGGGIVVGSEEPETTMANGPKTHPAAEV